MFLGWSRGEWLPLSGDRDLARMMKIAKLLDARMGDYSGGGGASTYTLSTNLQANLLSTAQTTSTAAYGDLATVGPSVTITIAASGLAIVTVSAFMNDNNASGFGLVSFAATGANTIAAADSTAIQAPTGQGGGTVTGYWVYSTALGTALTAGATTFTLKYKAGGGVGTANFANRVIEVASF